MQVRGTFRGNPVSWKAKLGEVREEGGEREEDAGVQVGAVWQMYGCSSVEGIAEATELNGLDVSAW